MKFAVFAYNFPHWKTQNGLVSLVCNGFKPSVVVLQERKELTVPVSSYRITPGAEYLQDPKELCKALDIPFVIMEHNEYQGGEDLGVILGARILSAGVIDRFKHGILNIHPGILPGNRGLDNLKWSLLNRLPVGVTTHFIDHRVDMGCIVDTLRITNLKETVREIYLQQRDLEMLLLIRTMKRFEREGINYLNYTPVAKSPKFSAVPEYLDQLFEREQRHFINSQP